MAASNSVLQPRKFNPFCHNYYDPLFAVPKSNKLQGALNYLPSSRNFSPTLTLIKSPISANSFYFTASTAHSRRLPPIIRASSDKSPEIKTEITSSSPKLAERNHQQLLHHFLLRMILEIITFIWRLPSSILGFLKKEDTFLDKVEDEIIDTANVVKQGAKVVEEVAEGLEDVALFLEKAAKTLDNDAKKVDAIMDEVKEKTKIAHDEIENVIDGLGGPVQDMEKDVEKVQAKVKGSKEEITNTPTSTKPPPSPTITTNLRTKSTNTLHYIPFQSIFLWRPQTLHINFESLSYFMSLLLRVFFGTMIMVSFLLVLGGMTNTHLVNYSF